LAREGRRVVVVMRLRLNGVPSAIRKGLFDFTTDMGKKPFGKDDAPADKIKAQIEADNLGTNVLGCFNRRAYKQGAPGAIR
jgi:hypothetical protein